MPPAPAWSSRCGVEDDQGVSANTLARRFGGHHVAPGSARCAR